MGSDVEVLCLLRQARRLGFATKPIEDMALALIELYGREGECVKFGFGWLDFGRELMEASSVRADEKRATNDTLKQGSS